MIDILTAARTALPNTMSSATSDNGKLFVTGYSQGGHVAMATQRAMQTAGMTVTGGRANVRALCAGSLWRCHLFRHVRPGLNRVHAAC